MAREILTPEEMTRCDRATISAGIADGWTLMRRAGQAVGAAILARFPAVTQIDVLCGPGNNGGDGYVAASMLAASGVAVEVWSEGRPRPDSDAAIALSEWARPVQPLAGFMPRPGALIVDALYGAGLSKPLSTLAASIAERCATEDATVVAVDLPSGISGLTGQADGPAFRATLTVTFARRKPGHLLMPGRSACGLLVVADIGIPDAIIASCGSTVRESHPDDFASYLAAPSADAHKYSRGHASVFSGGALATGASRLAALAAARAGAGAVTVLSPAEALAANAAHLTSIMLARVDDEEGLDTFMRGRKVASAVIGPGFGVGPGLRGFVLRLLQMMREGDGVLDGGLVLDADAITVFSDNPSELFGAVASQAPHRTVLTPHHGEFGRLFPEIAADGRSSKLEKALAAAKRAASIVVYKGPDTVIAAPDGRAAINDNGPSWLATAGSGDVLAGIVGGLLAQRVPAFEAACAAVWMHGEAARRFGPGLIAEDIPTALVPVLRDLHGGG